MSKHNLKELEVMRRNIPVCILSTLLAVSLLSGLTGCSSGQTPDIAGVVADHEAISTSQSAAAASKVTAETVTVAFSAASRPLSYVNDAGQPDGYEIQVLREIDELLPQYAFDFIDIPDDSDLLVGVETGKYDLGVKGAWVTDERRQKFIFPQNPIGATTIGLLYRTGNADTYTDLEAFGRAGGRLIPISPQSAQYSVIAEFNEAHPDAAIELVPAEVFDTADAYRWIIEGRYDGYFVTRTGYERTILEDDSPYHQYAEQLSYFTYQALPTWPLFNRENQAIADACDEAFLQLFESGRIDELMKQYLNENTFQYIGNEYAYLKPDN